MNIFFEAFIRYVDHDYFIFFENMFYETSMNNKYEFLKQYNMFDVKHRLIHQMIYMTISII